jgi:hypothetical protein
MNGLPLRLGVKKGFWMMDLFNLNYMTIYDMQVQNSTDADTYLIENYGNWPTPVTRFNCTTDTPNLTWVPNPIATFLVSYVRLKAQDPQISHKRLKNLFLIQDYTGQLAFSAALYSVSNGS